MTDAKNKSSEDLCAQLEIVLRDSAALAGVHAPPLQRNLSAPEVHNCFVDVINKLQRRKLDKARAEALCNRLIKQSELTVKYPVLLVLLGVLLHQHPDPLLHADAVPSLLGRVTPPKDGSWSDCELIDAQRGVCAMMDEAVTRMARDRKHRPRLLEWLRAKSESQSDGPLRSLMLNLLKRENDLPTMDFLLSIISTCATDLSECLLDDDRLLRRLLKLLSAVVAPLAKEHAAKPLAVPERKIPNFNGPDYADVLASLRIQSEVERHADKLVNALLDFVSFDLRKSATETPAATQQRIAKLVANGAVGPLMQLLGTLDLTFTSAKPASDNKSASPTVRTELLNGQTLTNLAKLLRVLSRSEAARELFLASPNCRVFFDALFFQNEDTTNEVCPRLVRAEAGEVFIGGAINEELPFIVRLLTLHDEVPKALLDYPRLGHYLRVRAHRVVECLNFERQFASMKDPGFSRMPLVDRELLHSLELLRTFALHARTRDLLGDWLHRIFLALVNLLAALPSPLPAAEDMLRVFARAPPMLEQATTPLSAQTRLKIVEVLADCWKASKLSAIATAADHKQEQTTASKSTTTVPAALEALAMMCCLFPAVHELVEHSRGKPWADAALDFLAGSSKPSTPSTAAASSSNASSGSATASAPAPARPATIASLSFAAEDTIVRCSNPACGKPKLVKTDLKKCGACAGARYCSPACQKADWGRHKPDCKRARQAT